MGGAFWRSSGKGGVPIHTSLRSAVARKAGGCKPRYWGIGLRGGVAQEVSLRAKAGGPTLRAQLCVDGAVLAGADLKPKGPARGGWQTYTAMLRPDPVPVGKASRSAELRLLVPPNSEATIDHVSLVPTDAVAGLFRKDIFDALKALRPGFVRFPGGDYLEGTGPRTRWDWKRTIGQPSDRKGHYNSAWDYWVRDRLGFFEMLQLAEALGSEPVLAVPTGLQLNKLHYGITRYGDPPANSSWAQEALDAIEFATAPAQGSNWGGFRAAMGRSEPFKLTKVEVGARSAPIRTWCLTPRRVTGLTRGATGEKPTRPASARGGRRSPRRCGSGIRT